jgi:tripartite-type tricarboxylate transporter receptor subunit TctC
VISYLRDNLNKAAHTDQFKTALTNLGQELAYLDQPDFAKFWAEDAKRIEDAIRQIGRVDS